MKTRQDGGKPLLAFYENFMDTLMTAAYVYTQKT